MDRVRAVATDHGDETERAGACQPFTCAICGSTRDNIEGTKT